MDLRKVIMTVVLVAGALSLINQFVGGLKFSGFRHARMMKNGGLDRDLKIAGGEWRMERGGFQLPAPETVPEIKVEPSVPSEPVTSEPEKKPGYSFQTTVKAMPMPKLAQGSDAKDKKKKKKKKKTRVARKSTNLAAPAPEFEPVNETAEKSRPTALNPTSASQLAEFVRAQQAPRGPGTADQVYAQLFPFGGNLQSIARLFELYESKQIEPSVFFAVIERVLMSPNLQFRMFAVQGLKGVVREETFERLAALMGIETEPRVVASLGSVLANYGTLQNVHLVQSSLKSSNPSSRYYALTAIKSAMQSAGSPSSPSLGSPREIRGGAGNGGLTAGALMIQKFQALAQAVREMQSDEQEKRIAALANETYHSILQFVQARRVAQTGS